jgi:hypothetical protein
VGLGFGWMMLNATLSIFQWYRGGQLYCWSYCYGYFKHMLLSRNNTDNWSHTSYRYRYILINKKTIYRITGNFCGNLISAVFCRPLRTAEIKIAEYYVK